MRLLEELLAAYPARDVIGDRVHSVERIVLDSRQAAPHTLFVARRGTQHDGLSYLRDAYDRGCRVVASDRLPAALPADCTFVLVDDLLGALAQWSHALYGFPSEQLQVFGVTGTNGKTTTTYIIAHLLRACGVPTALVGTLGVFYNGEHIPTHHTTPEAPVIAEVLARAHAGGCRAVAMEVSSHALWWRRVEGVRFAGAIFTNLTPEHLDFHRTMDNYARAKKRLFDMLPPGAPAVVFADSSWSDTMVADTRGRVIRVGRGTTADVHIAHEELSSGSSRWELRWNDGRTIALAMPLVGSYNVENASLAVVLLDACGYRLDQLGAALATVQPPPGRMECLSLGHVTAVVDYAHTPDALERLLRQCRAMVPPGNRLLCVFGCGGDRDRTKRPQMGAIAVALADVAILTSDNPRTEDPAQIVADIRAGIELASPEKRRAVVLEELDREQAIAKALALAQPGDWVVVAGKGHEEYQIIGTERVPFSDRQVLLRYGGVSTS
ncbi:MAG: UDP-N-acetylmuramoyl-L-alanyl-D-glutamate--2,6-diaminopimelate ligase [Bacteroidota bacterium]|nr:UDP-N-acetylmuramoyl-L-alanyl-D-glutamate--2,6-diaminopimelate ligase [Bacteroidota bacterium]